MTFTKTLVFFSFIFAFALQACQEERTDRQETPVTPLPDTLLLRTQKVKGKDLFGFGGGGLTFTDTSGLFPYPVNYPTNMTDLLASRQAVDFSTTDGDYIDIVTGKIEGEDVFIVDQNNNQDFTDDPVRQFRPVEWNASTNALLCYYDRQVEGNVIQDSSWVQIGLAGPERSYPIYARDEHLQTEVTLGETRYVLGAMDRWLCMTFTYGNRSSLAIFAENAETQDTLALHDIITTGEYLPLAGEHYRFDSITHDGSYITLVRDPQFASREGTQVGMLAPAFAFVTTRGDTLRSADMPDKPIVLANSCGCGGDQASGEAFTAIQNTYGEHIYALRLDSGFERPAPGWNADVEEPFNEDLYRKYRGEYCSRTAYLVGPDRRVLAKFDVTDWNASLSRHIDL